MQCGIGHCGHCQLGPTLVCRDGPVYRWSELEPLAGDPGAVMDGARSKPTLAVWKFSSCDGCQLSLLDCEDELLALADQLEIAYFLEATSATVEGPYDVSLVEGSITTAARRRADPARSARSSRALITIGACATAGGIQALRNFADVEEFTRDRLRLARLHLDARAPRRRSAPTSPSTSSCTAARSTSTSCSR